MSRQELLLAHSENEEGRPHLLVDHLLGTSRLAAELAKPLGLDASGAVAGLLHDLGKATPGFQRRVRGEPVSAPHSAIGAAAARELAGAHDLAFVIAGHHRGLPSLAEVKEQVAAAGEAWRPAWAALESQLAPVPRATDTVPPTAPTDRLALEVRMRMLFSTLVDADFLDTEAHFDRSRAEARRCATLDPESALASLLATIATKPREGIVNACRAEVLEDCLAAAARPPGFFSLTVPTGGGKTLSSLAFALEHARRNSLRRVIVVEPYLNIIEQTAGVLKEILGEELVLEHHSAAVPETDAEDDPALLAAENWDAPVVVTTAVQFLESLFADRPRRCRKVHNVAKSVVLLDEVQTLPPGLVHPILSMLRELQRSYGVTFVLCTATQPALGRRRGFDFGLDGVVEICRDPAGLAARLRRTEVEWPEPLEAVTSWEEVAETMRASRSTLCIVNTRRDAAELWKLLGGAAFHLSSAMSPAHRLGVLEEVRRRLAVGDPCLLVSTQLVEAGVDVDFGQVLRAMGPLDSIAQAAGRCNREGKRAAPGRVIVFRPEPHRLPPGSYGAAAKVTEALCAARPVDITVPATFERYFRSYYETAETDAREIEEARRAFRFPDVARRFRLIEEETVPVVVRYGDAAALLSDCRRQGRLGRASWRRLQRCCVSLARRDFDRADREGLIVRELPGLAVWAGRYDASLGLTWEATAPEELVV